MTTDYEDALNGDLGKVKKGYTLAVECETEMDDYFGPLEGMPTYSPVYVTKIYFTAEGKVIDTRRALGLLDAEFWHAPKYIPVLERVVEGLGKELQWAVDEEYARYEESILSVMEPYKAQLQRLKG